MKRILIVDDDLGSRESLKQTFSKLYEVTLAEHAKAALKVLADSRVDLVLLDVIMPHKDGLTLLREIQELYPDIPLVMVSASTSVRPVVEAIKAGAFDYVAKPFDVEEIRRIVARAIETHALRRRLTILEDEVSREYPLEGLIGDSPVFRQALDNARKAAESDATVLIDGESGTGKELVARLLHQLSGRREEPFVPVHCAALPETLMESELFGHEKGAFTNADTRKLGRFDLAGSGTLFFDEVGEMSLTTQVKLLRVLQEREYMRVGGTQVLRTNARITAATARNLLDAVHAGTFRDDLYYRLSVIPLHLPPLRERPEDIPLLARYFLGSLRQSLNTAVRDFSPEALELMVGYRWPGNIRELRNIVERTLVLYGQHELILPEFLPEQFRGPRPPTAPVVVRNRPLVEAVQDVERALIIEALREAAGVQTRAARLLGTTRRILGYRMRKLNIQPDALKGPAPQTASPAAPAVPASGG
jgi:DNA-binding NtrC family response regulator